MDTKFTGKQRAALILLSVSEENATKIFSMMADEEIKEISQAMSNLGSVQPEILNKALTQFANELMQEGSFLGNVQTTEKLLEKIIGKDKVAVLMDEIRGPQGKNTWEKLGNVNEDILASYLK